MKRKRKRIKTRETRNEIFAFKTRLTLAERKMARNANQFQWKPNVLKVPAEPKRDPKVARIPCRADKSLAPRKESEDEDTGEKEKEKEREQSGCLLSAQPCVKRRKHARGGNEAATKIKGGRARATPGVIPIS